MFSNFRPPFFPRGYCVHRNQYSPQFVAPLICVHRPPCPSPFTHGYFPQNYHHGPCPNHHGLQNNRPNPNYPAFMDPFRATNYFQPESSDPANANYFGQAGLPFANPAPRRRQNYFEEWYRPGKIVFERRSTVDEIIEHHPDFVFPMPIVIKTEPDIEVIQSERDESVNVEKPTTKFVKKPDQRETRATSKLNVNGKKIVEKVMESERKESVNIEKPTIKEPDKRETRASKSNVNGQKAVEKVVKKKEKPKIIPGWYSQKYGKQTFNKFKISIQKLTKNEIKDATKVLQKTVTDVIARPNPKPIAFPIAFWSTKDLLLAKPLRRGRSKNVTVNNPLSEDNLITSEPDTDLKITSSPEKTPVLVVKLKPVKMNYPLRKSTRLISGLKLKETKSTIQPDPISALNSSNQRPEESPSAIILESNESFLADIETMHVTEQSDTDMMTSPEKHKSTTEDPLTITSTTSMINLNPNAIPPKIQDLAPILIELTPVKKIDKTKTAPVKEPRATIELIDLTESQFVKAPKKKPSRNIDPLMIDSNLVFTSDVLGPVTLII